MNGNRIATAIFWVGIVVIVCLLFFASRPFGPSDQAVWAQMRGLVKSLVNSNLASGKPCPAAEIETLGNKELDAWGQPFKTMFRNGELELQSAGRDGAWNTRDDFHVHASIGPEKTTGTTHRGACGHFEFTNESQHPQDPLITSRTPR